MSDGRAGRALAAPQVGAHPAPDRVPPGRVVVGVDGSDNAEHALRWAASKSGTLGVVVPVAVYQRSTGGAETDPPVERQEAEDRLETAIAAAEPTLRGHGLVVEGHPANALMEAAGDADLLVVGTRGQSGLASTLLGSVSSSCATQATVPVAIVPPYCPTDRPLNDIVVGVDGSRHADRALRWAIDHLAPGGRIRAIGALPIWGAVGGGSGPIEDRLADQIEASIERVLEDVAPVSDDHREIVVIPVGRDARVVLREAAEDSDLLVIGRRGLSRISFLVVGSVAAALTHHPNVPTVVIPTIAHTPDEDQSDLSEGAQ